MEIEKLYNVPEAGQFLRLSKYTIRAKVYSRQLPYIKSGARVLFRESDLLRFLEKGYHPAVEK